MLLRAQLLLFALLCAAFPLSLSTFWSARIASRSIETELQQKSREVLSQVNTLTRNKIDSIFSYTFLVMSNPALALSVENKNWQLLSQVVNSIQKGLKLDIFEVLDDSGFLIYNVEEPLHVGVTRTNVPFIERLFEENRQKKSISILGIEKKPGGVAIEAVSILPKVSSRRDVSGAVLMGFYMGDAFLLDLKKVMNADLCLFSNGDLLSTTFQGEREGLLKQLGKILKNEEWAKIERGEDLVTQVALDGRRYIAAVRKITLGSEHLQLAVFLSSERADQARRASILYILLTGTLGVAIALALALALTRRLTRSIQTLTRAAEEIGQGHLQTRVEVAARDEIGFLAYTFNRMTAQLREAQEQLLRSERLAAIGQMASGVGHELRNPLAAIKNAVYFIRSVLKKNPIPGNENVEKMMEIMENEIEATVKISNDLLEFSRVSRINPTQTAPNDLLRSVFLVVTVPEKVILDQKLAEALPPVFVDPERMRQVFINLVNNAVEAMPEGGTLEIETCYNKAAASVEFYVRDSGAGIAPENQEKIFEPLFSTKAKGTGLGLAIVRGIVESHRGTIALRSAPGEGTEFLVQIPKA